jgi:hypothetical protein
MTAAGLLEVLLHLLEQDTLRLEKQQTKTLVRGKMTKMHTKRSLSFLENKGRKSSHCKKNKQE